jgi:hypothetical protein
VYGLSLQFGVRADHGFGPCLEVVGVDLAVGHLPAQLHQLFLPFQKAQAQALLRIFDIAPNGFLLSVDFFQPEVRKSHDDGSQEQQHSGQGRQHGKAVLPLRCQAPPPTA